MTVLCDGLKEAKCVGQGFTLLSDRAENLFRLCVTYKNHDILSAWGEWCAGTSTRSWGGGRDEVEARRSVSCEGTKV